MSARTSTETPSREQNRSRRKREIRARTISVKRMTKRELAVGAALYHERPGVDYQRPRTRAECLDGPRPCPYVSCQHHLYLDVSARTGAIKITFPDLELEELTETCALDVADRGGETLERGGDLLNMTRERVRQIEVAAYASARPELAALCAALDAASDEPRFERRHLPIIDDYEPFTTLEDL